MPRVKLLFTKKETAFLKKMKLCIISSIDKKGFPHSVPIRYTYDRGALYIPTHEKRKKIFNIRRNGKVAVLVTRFRSEDGKPEGLLTQGTAEILTSGEEYLRTGNKIGIGTHGFDKKTQSFTWAWYKQYIIKVKPTGKTSWGVNQPYRGSDTYKQLGVTD